MGWGESFRELDPVGDLNDILVETPRGAPARFLWRPETNDANLLIGISTHADEYKLRSRYVKGWALDVGAHIGGVSVQLLLDNPELRLIAVEALPDNVKLLQENLRRNRVADRAVVVEAAATASFISSVRISWGYARWGSHEDSYVAAHRFVGNQYRHDGEPTDTIDVPGVSLGALLNRYDIHEIELLKIDCEGSEWEFLTSTALRKVRYMIGEMHAGYDAPRISNTHEEKWDPGCHMCASRDEHILWLLEPTHRVEIRGEVFEAWRR